MSDDIFEGFLTAQEHLARELDAKSDIVQVRARPSRTGGAPRTYLVELECEGFVKLGNGHVVAHRDYRAQVHFSPEHLRRVVPELFLNLSPLNCWSPNIFGPLVCINAWPGIGVVDAIHSLYEVITYQKVSMDDKQALNPAASSWARKNLHRFPTQRSPLRRRSERAVVAIEIQDA